MARRVQHLSLHRIAGVELRVISDVEQQVLPLIQAEEAVVRVYANRPAWPHRFVTLFILYDLMPLVRQLPVSAGLDAGALAGMLRRPAVNVYDLADATSCHIFMNWQAMDAMGALGDPLAAIGLLAHEHAHPLSDNETTQASRRLRLDVTFEGWAAGADAGRGEKVADVLGEMADRLCLYAAREVLANDVALQADDTFRVALFALDQQSLLQTERSLAGREVVRRQLHAEVAAGVMTGQQAQALLLVGDLDGYLDMAMEIASFYRAGATEYGQQLEQGLREKVFSGLEPAVWDVFCELRRRYSDLSPAMSEDGLMLWSQAIMDALTEAVATRGLRVQGRVRREESGLPV